MEARVIPSLRYNIKGPLQRNPDTRELYRCRVVRVSEALVTTHLNDY